MTEQRFDEIFDELLDADCVCSMTAVTAALPDDEVQEAYRSFLIEYGQNLALGALEQSEWMCGTLIINANQEDIAFVRMALDALRSEIAERSIDSDMDDHTTVN